VLPNTALQRTGLRPAAERDNVGRTNAMRPELLGANEPVSLENPIFQEVVLEAIGTGRMVVGLIRYVNAGGSRDHYVLSGSADWLSLQERCRPGDAVTVFLPDGFSLSGIANPELEAAVVELLKARSSSDPEFESDLFAVASNGDVLPLTSVDRARAWLSKHPGLRIAVGELDFSKENGSDAVTAYAPGADGVVRRGGY